MRRPAPSRPARIPKLVNPPGRLAPDNGGDGPWPTRLPAPKALWKAAGPATRCSSTGLEKHAASLRSRRRFVRSRLPSAAVEAETRRSCDYLSGTARSNLPPGTSSRSWPPIRPPVFSTRRLQALLNGTPAQAARQSCRSGPASLQKKIKQVTRDDYYKPRWMKRVFLGGA